jgi:CheY-like chemotaxis protein
MFEMFSRGEHHGHHPDGLGIGLALARRLAEMHGGTLEAHSAGAGAGSEFTLRLPLAAGDAERAAEPPVMAAAFPRKRILVVDDNRDAADSLGMMLELLGAQVRVAHNGDEALEVFSRYDPAVVLLDIGMPGMDGYEVARLLRHRFPEHDATIVALTGWGQDSDRQRAREAGFDHHLIKPAEMTTLQALLGSLHQ